MDIPSRTAEGVAALRHMATKELDPDVRGGDVLAHRFLGIRYRVLAMLLTRYARRVYSRRVPGVYEWVLARSRHLDRRFVAGLEAGIRQVVILGAGYDTRAIRFKDHVSNSGARVFELDQKATQQRKIACLGTLRIPQVKYIPADLERSSLERILTKRVFDPAVPTLFVWEGVSMYLSESAVRTTFRSIAGLAAPGSRVLFDYCLRRIIERTELPYGAAEILAFTSARGEPMIWGIEPPDLPAFVEDCGFRVAEQWGPDDLQRMYLHDSKGRSIGDIGRYQHIAELERKPDLSQFQ